MIKRALFFVVAIFLVQIGFAQTTGWIEKTDEELAIQFYQEGEFEKARGLFENLIDKDGNEHLNDYYFNCLLKLEDYKTAEKFLKKEIRKSEKPAVLRIDLGYVYSLNNDEKQAKKTFEQVIDEMPNDEVSVKAIASAFERRSLDKYAVEAYLKGRKRSGINYVFANNLAELYGSQGQTEKMVDEYLLYANTEINALDEVKSALAAYIEDDALYLKVKETLIRKTQSSPDNAMYVDLLSWAFVSKKEFYPAFVQLKGLDKRLREGGKRIFDLAKVCVQNKEYRVAEQAYEYIKDYGNNSPYFYQAKLGAINMKYARVTQSAEYTQAELKQIESDYKAFVVDENVSFGEKYVGYMRLAEIQAIYLGDLNTAIVNLGELIENPRIPKIARGEMKLDLADYLLMRGDIWDAKLRYWQVEKDFKDNPLGHRAKFMKAKISFYQGDFELAQSFLKVLKGSTTELIANDALQLSLLIQDNLGLDTVTTPVELYAQADKFLFMNRLDDALATLDTISEFFPNHPLDDEILVLKGDVFNKKRMYDTAITFYVKVYTTYKDDILADDALYKAANILEFKQKEELKATALLEKLILEHRGSVFSVDASNRYRILREKYSGKKLSKSEMFFLGITPSDETP
ncbi:MAG: tetratricopeptide repeat protein [Bacteroidia bacterium]